MRFLFVDKIVDYQDMSITGIVKIPGSHPLAQIRNNKTMVPAGVVSEAIGQLASWLSQHKNNFTAKPVFLFADLIRIEQMVECNQTIELYAKLDSIDEQSLVFSGHASQDGQKIQFIEDINGGFIPLSDMEDPEAIKARWECLISDKGLELESKPGIFSWENFWEFDEIDRQDDFMTATKVLDEKLEFYRDHFPKMPVTPIVMINELIGGLAAKFLDVTPSELTALNVANIKIKNFWKPNEKMMLKVRRVEEIKKETGLEIEMAAELIKDKKRIMTAKYRYFVEKHHV
jgi:3-hydroxymyristoyl/3-hydroxydecanoyl-(acyl carrier protein) dehydratase